MKPLHRTHQLKSPELPPLTQSALVHYTTMLKDKLKLPDKARRVFPDRLGSLVSGFTDKEEENGDSNSAFEGGEELEILVPNACGSGEGNEDDYAKKMEEQLESGIRQRAEKEGAGLVSVKEVIAADDKRSDLEYELSQKEINLEKLQRIADTGLPEGGGLRATVWKLLLGYLPPSRDLWEKELWENREKYSKLKQELLLSPSEFTRIKDESLKSNSADNDGDGLLRRHEISQEDHPLSLGKASVWNQYFEHTEISEQIDRDLQRTHPDMKFFSGETSFSRKNREAMRNILLLFSKLNPAIRYVQGMNEVLAPLYYVFSADPDEQNAVNAEADSFSCFVRLLSDSVDHFCQQMDHSAVGILSTLSRLSELLKANNEELWHHLEITNKVKPQFYAFRWITLLLTQEFNFHSILRIWDSFLSNPFGVQDMLLRVCCAMLLCIRSRLLSGDFAANLKLLQHYPEINIEHLLQLFMAGILLHGILHVTIYETDKLSGKFTKSLRKIEEVLGIRKGFSKLYITIDVEKARVGRTRIIENKHSHLHWNECFHIYCAHMASNIIFSIKKSNPIGAKVIGRAYFPVEELLDGEEVDRWLKIWHNDHKPLHSGSKIHVKLQFYDATRHSNWSRGIRSSKFPGVPYTFFPQRNGCRVTLYQDAHTPDKFIPEIPLVGGKFYEPQRCWEDIFDAITNAKHLIYITGWSVYAKITLIRDLRLRKPGGNMTLGELLVRKASEGVTVLMLVWDDRTSGKLLKHDGVMATHDEDTGAYFHNTGVHCVLCPRNPDNGQSIVQDLEISTMFTHHQKSLIVDSEMPSGASSKRRIVSFIGGIDLCDGRYDTPFHPIFRTLDSVHHNDFHQPCFPGASIAKGGPREPWHDIHSKLEGPIAWDVLFNFEQRWRKQGGKDLLVKLKELDNVFIPPSAEVFPQDHDTWNVQLFRSIDGGAAFGFPETPEDAARAGLISGKDSIIDRSIQDAYINAIRRAKEFIYIENQYFLGSSFCWKSDDIKVEEVGALNLVPKELSLKVVSKIESGERFTVYIVIPMWPEGIPESASVQAILNWQKRTMEMIYTDIAQALQAKNLEANPKDYLSFFCLANRESKNSDKYTPSDRPEHKSNYHKAQEARRFMIYVHAKMMIVDDEYIIIGSANINQRSMDGARDSEIAMGAYQPYHLSTKQPARGQIHGFRMALWYEHLGLLNESFLQPASMECVRKVNEIAEKYWRIYTSETADLCLPGHLISYPISIKRSGEVTHLPGTQFFPDTEAPILGSKSEILPPILTT